MHKRKYTREQLEFYFKTLMERLKRIPREEDLEKAKDFPSVKAYVDRFGSWQNTVDMYGNKDLSKRKCLNCGNAFIRQMKTQKFCSKKCQLAYYSKRSTTYTKAIDSKVKRILGESCFICDFPHMLQVHSLDNKKDSDSKILRAYNKKDLHDFVLLCPNHHMMLHSRLARLTRDDNELVWYE